MTNKLLEHFKKMQADCLKYILPDSKYSMDGFVDDIIVYLDGPEQREAQAEAELGYAGVINSLSAEIFNGNVEAGWYSNPQTGERIERNIPEMLMLIVSEVAEGMEGHRKKLMDDKLPHRSMLEVELADVMIRVFDLAGYQGLDLGGAIVEKRAYNATRLDHKLETRKAEGGKAF